MFTFQFLNDEIHNFHNYVFLVISLVPYFFFIIVKFIIQKLKVNTLPSKKAASQKCSFSYLKTYIGQSKHLFIIFQFVPD